MDTVEQIKNGKRLMWGLAFLMYGMAAYEFYFGFPRDTRGLIQALLNSLDYLGPHSLAVAYFCFGAVLNIVGLQLRFPEK